MSHAQYTWPSYQYPLTNTANTTNTTNTANITNNTLWQLMLGCKPGLPDKRWRWPPRSSSSCSETPFCTLGVTDYDALQRIKHLKIQEKRYKSEE